MQTPKEKKGEKGGSPSTKKEKPVPRTSFPVSRIKTIMKSSPDTNTIGVDALALTARAAVSSYFRSRLKKAVKQKKDNSLVVVPFE